MKTRIITAVVATLILLPVLIFADYPVLPIALSLVSLIAVFEMLRCIGLHRAWVISVPLYLLALALPICIRLLSRAELVKVAFAAIVFLLFYFFAILLFSHGKYKLADLSVCFMTVLYILIGFNAILYVHDHVYGGEYVYLIAFIGAWITDIFAYFCGMLFGRGGKHKLIPDVSPKKTVEGSIGGIVFCILSMMLYGWIVSRIEPSLDANVAVFAVAGLLISIVSQIGDLCMSLIKRTYGIKDYGKLFPGHGGMLDRFDSVIAVSTVLLVITGFAEFF
ncbi:MAG: phosphatidate cytidylyltransferase [Clostridia bacterium]|nr:phosphatidate cytidylyltransferase [Clostridia bacterium]